MLQNGRPLICDRIVKEIEIRIASDRERGASELYREALAILRKWLAEEVLDEQCFKRMLGALVKGQPSMAPMLNLANRLLLSLVEGWDKVKEEVDREIEECERRIDEVVSNAVKHLAQFRRFATVSYSSTIKRLFERLSQEKEVSLMIGKGDPVEYGLRLADELVDFRVETWITTDALLPYAVKQVDAVVVGADSVDEYSLVNGAGTFALVLAARHYGVPVYVVCGTEKFLPTLLSRYHVVKEEPFPQKLQKPHKVFYRIFDVTPVDLITGFITEKGVWDKEAFKSFISQLPVSNEFHSLLEL